MSQDGGNMCRENAYTAIDSRCELKERTSWGMKHFHFLM